MTTPERIELELEAHNRQFAALLRLAAGRKVYLVGGTIRDILMGREPTDFDLAVSGPGIELARKFARSIRGKFVLLSEPDDLARVVYLPSAGPQPGDPVTFDFNGFGESRIEEDLSRRDFTINAIAVELRQAEINHRHTPTDADPLTLPSPHRGEGAIRRLRSSALVGGSLLAGPLIDPFRGQEAIAAKRLVPVSPRSLELDPLRLLRAVRFALELGFDVDADVWAQAGRITLDRIAPERVGYEMMRIMTCPGSSGYVKRLYELGFLEQMFTDAFQLFEQQDLMRHSLGTYRKIEEIVHGDSYFSAFAPEFKTYFEGNPRSIALLKLAGLFHDVAKPETEFVNDRNEVHFYGHDSIGAKQVEELARDHLRLSRDDTRTLKTLVEFHMRLHLLATGPELTDRAIRRFFRDLEDQYFGLMILTFADGFATAGQTRHLEEKFARMIALKRELDARVKIERLVNGNDLIALGMKPGPQFKVILAELEELQIEGKIAAKQEGLDYVKTHMAQSSEQPATGS